MIIRLGLADGEYVMCDDEITESRPTPEWIEDTANRLRRTFNDMHIELLAVEESFERRAVRDAAQEGDD